MLQFNIYIGTCRRAQIFFNSIDYIGKFLIYKLICFLAVKRDLHSLMLVGAIFQTLAASL